MEHVVNWRIGASRIRSVIGSAKGFTLIEALVVVSILAIMTSLAIPSFISFIGTMNTKSAAFDLIGDLSMARSEALKRNVAITVAPVEGAWTKGWQVLRPSVSPEVAPVALRERESRSSTVAINAPVGGIVFQPNGRLQGSDTGPANIKWSITSSASGAIARCVVISPTGSARSHSGACS
jgi:type IV fimbrial biogenesis protein FimT